jgi:hypothetical protein
MMDFKELEAKITDPKYAIPASIVALVILATVGFFYFQSQQNQTIDPNNQQAVQEDNNRILSEVGKLMDLPPGETPQVLTVTDISQLQGQPFFARAQNGDKVIVYSGAQRAILYDPKSKKIREVSPINNTPPASDSATPIGDNNTALPPSPATSSATQP